MENVLEKILEEIKDLKEKQNSSNQDYATGYLSALSTVEGIISGVKENDGWIPVEERLPEDLEKVLVWYEYFRYGEYNCMFETYGIGWQLDGHWGGDVSGIKARCIAWQPLPEAYHPKETPAAEHIMSRFTRVE